MPALTTDAIAAQAAEFAKEGDPAGAAARLIASVGTDRGAIEAARDLVASQLHDHGDDWGATAALTVLNRVLSTLPRNDPMDWRVRWSHHRKP